MTENVPGIANASEIKRAAVLIGVKKTGTLPGLQATQKAVSDMQKWAAGQRFDIVTTISDETGPVEPRKIKDAIKGIVDRGTVEQLIVYFTGHGVNIRYGEYWLLTDAPSDTQAAVNVDGSVVLARQAGIPHVVFISDACRTAAEGIQAQAVSGSEIFPNDGPSGPERSIDLFFACTLGKPALEVKSVVTSSRTYSAAYTDVLVGALSGLHGEVVDGAGYIRPWPLKRFLSNEVTRYLGQRSVKLELSQTPDARITSEPTAWLSRVPLRRSRGESTPVPSARSETLLTVSENALRTVLGAVSPVGQGLFDQAAAADVPQARLLSQSISRVAGTATADSFSTHCGFRIHGARIVDAYSRKATVEHLDDVLVRVDGLSAPAANVLLVTDSGTGVVVPAIRNFVAALTFEDRELVNVAYEPAETSHRWIEFQSRMGELRALRNVIAASARFGVFRLDVGDTAALARRMQFAKSIDPTMALYAAYAYHDLNRRDRLIEMEQYLFADVGLKLFDISLLNRELSDKQFGSIDDIFPFVPMLAQGWALLSAYRVKLPQTLRSLQRQVLPSLWTLLDSHGVSLVREAMQSEEVR